MSVTFKITDLSASGAYAVEADRQAGDDRGGIAISGSQVFLTGDSATAGFDLSLSSGASLGVMYDALIGNVATGQAYTLGDGTTPLGFGGGTATTLIPIDETGALLTASVITLSQPIAVGGGSGLFSGYNRADIFSSNGRVYDIDLATGNVLDLGYVSRPAWNGSESWAVWGTAEYFDGGIWVNYAHGSSIYRYNVLDGTKEAVASFDTLSDMASFTVSPETGRWYYHYEGLNSHFGDRDETLGYASASFAIAPGNFAPIAKDDVDAVISFGFGDHGTSPTLLGYVFDSFRTHAELGVGNSGSAFASTANNHGHLDGADAAVTREGGGNFALQSLSIASHRVPHGATLVGYRDGVQVASIEVDLTPYFEGYASLTFGSEWSNIDELRIFGDSGTHDQTFIDNLVLVEPAPQTRATCRSRWMCSPTISISIWAMP